MTNCEETLLRLLCSYSGEIATIGGPVLGSLVLLVGGTVGYYKQKEYELVRERYLDGEVDYVARQVVRRQLFLRVSDN